jgi:hypothetical protein
MWWVRGPHVLAGLVVVAKSREHARLRGSLPGSSHKTSRDTPNSTLQKYILEAQDKFIEERLTRATSYSNEAET